MHPCLAIAYHTSQVEALRAEMAKAAADAEDERRCIADDLIQLRLDLTSYQRALLKANTLARKANAFLCNLQAEKFFPKVVF